MAGQCQDGDPALHSSLDPENLTVEFPAPGTHEQDHRFRNCLPQRVALLTHLPDLPLSDKQRSRFLGCGRNAWVQHSASHNRYRIRSDTCKLRWCPSCHASKGHHVREYLRQFIDANRDTRLRLVTLTLRHSPDPLRDQLDRLRKAFRRLRQRKFWKSCVAGGIGTIEIKRTDAGEWHPHLHIVATGRFIDQDLLSREWLQVTANSRIVDVREVYTHRAAIEYLCKYVTKPPPIENLLTLEVATDWILGLERSRLLIPFGNVQPYEPDQESDDYPTDWSPVSSLADLLERRADGDMEARIVLHTLENLPDEPLFDHFQHGPPSPVP
ncbi:hypothetical protein LCGC14_2136620 [marine sediment metagenome]|uniref:Replication protein n=1 Tax=marine sediment metagenome TaxID=412755 RepID=A0A0F9DZW5_9ZZZZ